MCDCNKIDDTIFKVLQRIERKVDELSHQFVVRRKAIINEDGKFEQEVIFLDSLINNKCGYVNDLSITKIITDKENVNGKA